MKEKVRHLIATQLSYKSQLKLTLNNLRVTGALTDNVQDAILDELNAIDETVQKLEMVLRNLSDEAR